MCDTSNERGVTQANGVRPGPAPTRQRDRPGQRRHRRLRGHEQRTLPQDHHRTKLETTQTH